MEKVIDYLQNEVREAKSIVKLDNGEFGKNVMVTAVVARTKSSA